MINITKWFHQLRAGLSSEAELKYTMLANTAEVATDAARSCERLDKLKSKAKASSLTAKICKTFEQDMEDLLG